MGQRRISTLEQCKIKVGETRKFVVVKTRSYLKVTTAEIRITRAQEDKRVIPSEFLDPAPQWFLAVDSLYVDRSIGISAQSHERAHSYRSGKAGSLTRSFSGVHPISHICPAKILVR